MTYAACADAALAAGDAQDRLDAMGRGAAEVAAQTAQLNQEQQEGAKAERGWGFMMMHRPGRSPRGRKMSAASCGHWHRGEAQLLDGAGEAVAAQAGSPWLRVRKASSPSLAGF